MMVLYVLLGVLAFLLLLLLLPIGVSLRFDGELTVRVRYAGIPILRYSSADEKQPKKPSKQAVSPRKQAKAAKKQRAAKPKEKAALLPDLAQMLKEDGVGAVAGYLAELAKLAKTAAGRLLAAILIDRLELLLEVGGEEAADIALTYGKLCGVVYPAQTVLETLLRVRRRQVQVRPNFLRESSQARVRLHAHMLPLRLLWVALRTLTAFLLFTKQDGMTAANSGQTIKRESDRRVG